MNSPKSLHIYTTPLKNLPKETFSQAKALLKPFTRSPPPLRVAKTDSFQMFKISQSRGDADELSEGESLDFSDELSSSLEEGLKFSSQNETVKLAPFSMVKHQLTESTKFQGFLNGLVRGSPDVRSQICEWKEDFLEGLVLKKDWNWMTFFKSHEAHLNRSVFVGDGMEKRFEELAMIEKMSMQARFGKNIGKRRN